MVSGRLPAALVVALGLIVAVPARGATDSDPSSSSSARTPYRIAPPPAWVDPTFEPAKPDAARGAGAGGSEYLLLDRQIRIDQGAAEYVRHVVHPTNSAGVEAQSQISLEFDPIRERLTVHHVRVLRGEQIQDQLLSARRSVLQRETGLSDSIVDGRLTLHLMLDDLRVGDRVDYAYTIERRSPEWGHRYSTGLRTQWSSPVGASRVRVMHREARALRVADRSGAEPVVGSSDGWRTLEWRWRELAALIDEDARPSWYAYYPAIELSEFEGWGEVVERALPMYALPPQTPVEIAALALRLQAGTKSDAERVVAVLRFVQDEIRYTGIAIGEGAYVPTRPTTVLKRRYGDCKDKTLLAVALLHALGIEADPGLVSTRWQRSLATRLPSPLAFDHAIVRVRLDGRSYWFDPTLTAQGGSLISMQQSQLGAGLAIAPGNAAIEMIDSPVPEGPQVVGTSTFDLRQGKESPAELRIATRYLGGEADAMRRRLQTTSHEELARSYLQFYATRYPGITSAGPVETRDDRARNELIVEERYRLAKAFATGDDGTLSFEVDADLINDQLPALSATERRSPYGLPFPKHVQQRVDLLLPESWPVSVGTKRIDGPGFEYRSSVTAGPQQIHLDHLLRMTADHVTPRELARHAEQRENARLDTFFSLTDAGTPRLPAAAQLNPWISGALLAGLLAGALLWRRIANGRELDGWRRTPVEAGPMGLGGWMILPTLHTLALPLLLLFVLATLWPFLDASTWDRVLAADSFAFSRAYPALVLAAVVFATALLVSSIRGIVELFRRSVSFPALYIGNIWALGLLGILLAAGAQLVPGQPDSETLVTWIAVARDLFSALIWTLYMLRSARVRSTFGAAPVVEPVQPSAPAPAPEPRPALAA